MCCQRVIIGDEKITVILLLHTKEVFYRAKIISEVQIPRTPNTTNYSFHMSAKIVDSLFSDTMIFPEIEPAEQGNRKKQPYQTNRKATDHITEIMHTQINPAESHK